MSKPDGSRRTFFMHPAHRMIGVSAGLAAWQACQAAARFAATPPLAHRLRACVLADLTHDRPRDSLAALVEHLATQSVQCSRAFHTANHAATNKTVWGLNLDRCDCLILLGPTPVAGEPLERIERFCRRGGALVGLQAVADAFECRFPLVRRFFGVDCGDRRGAQSVEIARAPTAEDHPLLYGVDGFRASVSAHGWFRLHADATVLLTAAAANRSQPVAWIRMVNGAGVFCTSLGHRDDFHTPAFLRLLTNALAWTTRQAF